MSSKQFLPQIALALSLTGDWGYDDDQRVIVQGEVIAGGGRLGVAGHLVAVVFAPARTQAVERTLEKSNVGIGSVLLVERVMRQPDGTLVAEWVRTITTQAHDGRTVIGGYAASPVIKLPNPRWSEGEPLSIRWPLADRSITVGERAFDRAWLGAKVTDVAELAEQATRDVKIAQRKNDATALNKARERAGRSRITVTTDLLKAAHALVVSDQAAAHAAIAGALAANMGFALLRRVGGFPGQNVRISRGPNQTTVDAIARSVPAIAALFAEQHGVIEVIPGQVIAAMAMLKTSIIGDLKTGAGLKLAEIERVWDTPGLLASVLLPVQELTQTASGAFQMLSLPVPAEPERFAVEGLPSPAYLGKNLKRLPFTADSGFRGENVGLDKEAA